MNLPLVLTQFLDRAVTYYGDKTAVITGTGSITYRELNGRVQRLSHGLQSEGIQKGDKVAYLAPNSLEMLEGFYGLFQAGAVMVPLNTRLKPEDNLFILDHSEAKLLFADEELYSLIKPIKDKLKTVRKIIVHAKSKECPETGYDEWIMKFPETAYQRAGVDEEDLASLLYTSGTTGDPKGVMLTHRNNYLHAMSSMHALRVSDRDVYLHVLPMFHVNGWGSPFYYTANGATHVCLKKTDPKTIFDACAVYGVTVMHMAPTVLNSLLQYNDENKPEIPKNVRVMIAGSAPPPSFVERVETELGWEFIQVYGMTESSPYSTYSVIRPQLDDLSSKEQYRLKAKAGFGMIGSEVRIVNEFGDEVPHDGISIGEVTVRSHGVMKGYWKNEQATKEAIQNGWLYTGDMATVDEHGYIDILDRKKDIIISGGENISSIEVEGVLYEHKDIVEAAVIAVPHEKWGETPHAFVVKRPSSEISEQEIIDFSRSRLAHFKAVTGVTFVKELPKTASGKIQKVHLRNEYWDKAGKTGRFVN
ncbi:AMP-dependent synthetase [Domibacillus antri]|uniref:AMP-dependent synthetase n=1 Tax=Domibacillus antri TaxID=1714264 RepID=A0A1Q8Q3L6_9BACI|nr:long-chain-fatty-acid--CoA ligase [Domibacillus antri]OLN21934.1 AMP-dependent synthetase [Domibacillus antri]